MELFTVQLHWVFNFVQGFKIQGVFKRIYEGFYYIKTAVQKNSSYNEPRRLLTKMHTERGVGPLTRKKGTMSWSLVYACKPLLFFLPPLSLLCWFMFTSNLVWNVLIQSDDIWR